MRERIVAFDYLRALAITGILLCHFCHNYNSISFLGHYFGGVFVTLFIAMSGMLFGIVWNNNSRMDPLDRNHLADSLRAGVTGNPQTAVLVHQLLLHM